MVGSVSDPSIWLYGGSNLLYISVKNGPFKVEGTPDFEDWFTAKYYLATNWKAMYDDIFEREILGGSEESGTNDTTEN